MDTSQRAFRGVCRLMVVVMLCGLAGVNGRQVERIPRTARHTPALRHTRIVGGNVTTQGQFPSMVREPDTWLVWWGACCHPLLTQTFIECLSLYNGTRELSV
ncbi:hypothetical protein E2C01_101911 [Portunus trituberculatus]|uniref:Secreted protein n=1 Tax=Portunus trituberculatus TaxID=210409 RepID=A0A5B7KB11_PORTR|nr:hypothetical protein [Portunus trituberculatus]